MSNITYTKADASDPAVVALAKSSGCTVAEVTQVINGQRYRAAYNRAKQEENKKLRALLKANPDLLKEVK